MTRPDYPSNLDFLIASFSSGPLDLIGSITETTGTLSNFFGTNDVQSPSTTGMTITYAFSSFETSGLEEIEGDPNLFLEFSDELKDIIRATLNEISEYINITFIEVEAGDNQDGVRHLEIAGTNGAGGRYANAENSSDDDGFVYIGIADFDTSDGRSFSLADDEQFNDGTFPSLKHIVLHEITHALGLFHPTSDNAEETFLELFGEEGPPELFQSLTRLPDALNTSPFTVVGATNVGFSNPLYLQEFSDAGNNVYTELTTLGLLDILALQRLYGTNTSATAGNDTYTFKPEQALYQVIYDADGIDTFSFIDQIRGVNIDIREGALSSAGLLETNPGNSRSDPQPELRAQQNIAVAFNTIIENVIGSNLDDEIIGNDSNNSLIGNEGNDTLDGGAGNDVLRGDAGDDVIIGGAGDDRSFAGPGDLGDDTVQGNTGNDIIGGGAGNDFLVGGDINSNSDAAGADTLFGGAGNDLLVGGSYDEGAQSALTTGTDKNIIYAGTGTDTLFGDNGDDVLGGGAGGDSITGADGDDTIYGGIGTPTDNADTLSGGAGNDEIFGAVDVDIVNGGAGNDTLFGGGGNDTVDGGAGNDLIFGGPGNDLMTGGSGDDTFAFVSGFGFDVITDFSTDDILDFAEVAGLTIETVTASATFSGGNTTLTLVGHGTLTLNGIDETEFQGIINNGQILI